MVRSQLMVSLIISLLLLMNVSSWITMALLLRPINTAVVVSAFTMPSVVIPIIHHQIITQQQKKIPLYLNHNQRRVQNDKHVIIASTTTSSSTIDSDELLYITSPKYRSPLLSATEQWECFIDRVNQVHQPSNQLNCINIDKDTDTDDDKNSIPKIDLFWEQIKYEAEVAIRNEQQAGSQLYQGILTHASFMTAICTIISHEIATELITATTLKDLFINMLSSSDDEEDHNTVSDFDTIRQDLYAVAIRDPSIETAMEGILFHKGFHALVCYRVGHRLWQVNRTGLAYYIQSTVSRIYSTDIHPACRMGSGIYLRVGVGVVIGETAVVGNDVSIFEGVTLGGTGKESGDRHPKVSDGVVIYDGGAVLGNILIGEGSIISAKSIVTKPLPPLAIVSGVPAIIQSYRNLNISETEFINDDLQKYLIEKYLHRWCILNEERLANITQTK